MTDSKALKQGVAVYDTVCRVFDEMKWHYEKNDEKLTVYCKTVGYDLPISLSIEVDCERMLIFVLSHMPFSVPKNKRLQLSVAVTAANYGIVDGSFDYDFTSGEMLYRVTSSFRNSLIDEELIKYLVLYITCVTVDKYNDKFKKIIDEDMPVDEILAFIK